MNIQQIASRLGRRTGSLDKRSDKVANLSKSGAEVAQEMPQASAHLTSSYPGNLDQWSSRIVSMYSWGLLFNRPYFFFICRMAVLTVPCLLLRPDLHSDSSPTTLLRFLEVSALVVIGGLKTHIPSPLSRLSSCQAADHCHPSFSCLPFFGRLIYFCFPLMNKEHLAVGRKDGRIGYSSGHTGLGDILGSCCSILREQLKFERASSWGWAPHFFREGASVLLGEWLKKCLL